MAVRVPGPVGSPSSRAHPAVCHHIIVLCNHSYEPHALFLSLTAIFARFRIHRPSASLSSA